MKKIPLTKGRFAVVDDDDYAEISKYKWNYGGNYARRHSITVDGERHDILMHRVINKTKHGMDTDHINGDKLDNRKSNLRSATRSQNKLNTIAHKDSKSGFKGVSWHKPLNKWRVQITVNYHTKHLGYFESISEAIGAYEKAAVKYFGVFAKNYEQTQVV